MRGFLSSLGLFGFLRFAVILLMACVCSLVCANPTFARGPSVVVNGGGLFRRPQVVVNGGNQNFRQQNFRQSQVVNFRQQPQAVIVGHQHFRQQPQAIIVQQQRANYGFGGVAVPLNFNSGVHYGGGQQVLNLGGVNNGCGALLIH